MEKDKPKLLKTLIRALTYNFLPVERTYSSEKRYRGLAARPEKSQLYNTAL